MCSTSNTSFISALTLTMAGNQLYVCAFCVYRLYVFGGKINAWKKKHFTQTVLFSYPVCPLSLQPGQLITSSHHWLFLHNNKNAINIYGNAVWKQEATPSLMPAECTRLCTSLRLCVRACLSVCFFCICARCVHPDPVFRGNCSLWCSQCRELLIPLLACTELMQATLVLVPPKTGSFQC